MAYLLRTLILIMIISIALTTLVAMGKVDIGYGHIEIAIPTYLYCIFAQAFVMFYFIGTSRMVENIYAVLHSEKNLHELFDNPPEDLDSYKKETKKFVTQATRSKRQTIPWTMLMIILGMAAFLLGGAHDTGLVEKTTHVGLVYGFIITATIGFFRQWYYLGKTHLLLRKIKGLFELPDGEM